jgi:hypothetical protein
MYTIQSARLSGQSSDWVPSPASGCVSPTFGSWGGGGEDTLACGGGGGGANSDEGTGTLVLYVYYIIPLRRELKYTDKKENKIFLTYQEIQMGAVAKSYMRKGFLIQYMKRCANFSHIGGGRLSYMTNRSLLDFLILFMNRDRPLCTLQISAEF